MEPYGLFWYEEPGDPLDYQLNAMLAEHYAGALATGENLFSAHRRRATCCATAACAPTATGCSSIRRCPTA